MARLSLLFTFVCHEINKILRQVNLTIFILFKLYHYCIVTTQSTLSIHALTYFCRLDFKFTDDSSQFMPLYYIVYWFSFVKMLYSTNKTFVKYEVNFLFSWKNLFSQCSTRLVTNSFSLNAKFLLSQPMIIYTKTFITYCISPTQLYLLLFCNLYTACNFRILDHIKKLCLVMR